MSGPGVQFSLGGLLSTSERRPVAGGNPAEPGAVQGEGKSQVVVMPQYRRKALDGEGSPRRGEICHALARQQEWRISEGHWLAAPGPRCLESPPKHAVASVSGLLKGKSALAIARRVQEKERHCAREHCGARGEAVSTVGFEPESVKKYIREQGKADKEGRF